MVIKTLLIIVVLVGSLSAQTVTRKYVVHKDLLLKAGYTEKELTDKGYQNIADAGGQPLRKTRVLQTPVTWYFEIDVTPTDKAQDDFFLLLDSSELSIHINDKWILDEYNPRFGGNVKSVKVRTYNSYPKDFYVHFSTDKVILEP